MDSKKPHKKLDVWKMSMQTCRDVYEICEALPIDEKYGLASQMKRAAISIPSNIAEGVARNTAKEFIRFLCIAHSSSFEKLSCRDIVFVVDYYRNRRPHFLLLPEKGGKLL